MDTYSSDNFCRIDSPSPLVSVIVPNYNHAPYLKERIDSVLAQSFKDFELILLDDCSSDSSRDILDGYRHNPHVSHIVFNERNSGSTFAQWKRGLALAHGKYVWIAESDDFASADFLATLVPLLEKNPGLVLAFSGSVMVDADSQPIPGADWDRFKSSAPDISLFSGKEAVAKKLLWTADIYNASMVVFRRDAAPEITEEHMKMRYCGDWLFWVNICRKGGAVQVRRKLNYFRQHNAKVSPGASKNGLYFLEGLPVMINVAELLNLTPGQRAMLAGRTWKRLGKFPHVLREHRREILDNLNRLSPGASSARLRLIATYELDKYFNFTGLQPR